MSFTRYSRSQLHSCTIEHRDLEYTVPSRISAWMRLKQYIKELISISERYPKTSRYFQSRASIMYERKRHWKSNYAYIIHPFSLLRVYWEVFMFIIYSVSLSFYPSMIAFVPYRCTVFQSLLDAINLTDIILNFFTGVFERTYCEVILDHGKIARKYLCGYFIFDLVSSLPLEFRKSRGYQPLTPIPLDTLRLLKIVRLPTVSAYLATTMNVLNLRHFRIVKFNLLCLFVLHWTACAHYIVPKIMAESRGHWHADSWVWQAGLTKDDPSIICYVFCLFRAACCIFCVDIPYPLATEDIILTWISFLFGKLFAAYLMVVWLQYFMLVFGNEAKHQDIITQLYEYMRSEKLPLDLQKRMLSYYNYRYKNGYFRSSAINASLSENLKIEISTYCCRNLLEKVNIFKDLPDDVLEDMMKKMESEIYLPNDIIIKAGSIGRSVYFLVSGTIAVFTNNGKEICHLQDGAFFGEIALMVKDYKRIATVIALEVCMVYTLDKRHFRRAFENHPELLNLIQEEANRRMESTVRVEALHKKMLEEPSRRLLLREQP